MICPTADTEEGVPVFAVTRPALEAGADTTADDGPEVTDGMPRIGVVGAAVAVAVLVTDPASMSAWVTV